MSKKQMTLAEFVDLYGGREAARRLGMSHVAVKDAVDSDRDITLLVHEYGMVTGTETKPFPGRKPNKLKT